MTEQRVPFPDRRGAHEFNRRFTEAINDAVGSAIDEIIPPENNHALYHGLSFTQRRSDGSEMRGEVERHSAQMALQFDDIVTADLSVLPRQIGTAADQMRDEIMRTLYATVSKAVEEVGNVVEGKGKPATDAYLEMLRKIEFGVDRKGKVTRPQIHASPEIVTKLTKALSEADQGFQEEVKRITGEKEAKALLQERNRIGRFKKRTD